MPTRQLGIEHFVFVIIKMFITLQSQKLITMATLRNLAFVLLGVSSLFSCIKHVVIPPPLPMVELNASFLADTNGTQISYIKGINGFDIKATNYREILSPPQQSNITYFCSMESINLIESFKVSIGRDFWSSANGAFPPVNQFRVFFESLTNVPFSDNANAGVVLEWRDANNQFWKTQANSPFPQTFQFVNVKQESDETGDYLKFTAVFSATFFSPDGSQQRTLNNGLFVGYFKNN